jgi:cellulose synthase/poly-beta-1,6-N-acetylglucosamine synthase-like glycosyltransferase
MYWVFLILSSILFMEGVLTLLKVLRFRRFFLRELGRKKIQRHPKVAIFAPMKGVDSGMRENIQSWFRQEYPDFKIFFICDELEDPAVEVIRTFPEGELIIAGKATDCGQKVHNLRFAIRKIAPEYEVFAFVDSDCNIKPDWLSNLVAQLVTDPDNAATGYRWFTNTGNAGSILRSAWNSSVLTLYREKGDDNFAWGGSTAIFRKTFESARVLEFWQGSISDDYSLTNALKASGRRVNFVPGSLAFTHDTIRLPQFLQWTFRQLLITRIYYPHLWSAAFVFHCAWILWIFSGLFFLPQFLVAFFVIQLIQGIKADLRWQCIRTTGETSSAQRFYLWLLGPAVAFSNFLLTLSTIFTRGLKWRDVEYILLSRNRLIVRRR